MSKRRNSIHRGTVKSDLAFLEISDSLAITEATRDGIRKRLVSFIMRSGHLGVRLRLNVQIICKIRIVFRSLPFVRSKYRSVWYRVKYPLHYGLRPRPRARVCMCVHIFLYGVDVAVGVVYTMSDDKLAAIKATQRKYSYYTLRVAEHNGRPTKWQFLFSISKNSCAIPTLVFHAGTRQIPGNSTPNYYIVR